jgi:hypothetical protein
MNGTTSFAHVVEAKPAPWRWVFRIIRWTSYAAVLIAMLMIMHAAPPPPVVTSSKAAARAEQKLQDVEQAVSAGQPATLRLDETELNSFLASHLDISTNPAATAAPAPSAPTSATPPAGIPPADLEQARSSVRDVKVQLIEDRVRAYVVFDFHGKDMTLQLEGRLGTSDGYLRFEPVSGQLGALPIPQSTLDAAVRRMMDSPENREKLRLPAEISDLRIENGEIIASYK